MWKAIRDRVKGAEKECVDEKKHQKHQTDDESFVLHEERKQARQG